MFHNETLDCFKVKHNLTIFVILAMSKISANILVIDDEPDLLHTARFVLKPYFTKIIVESNPQQLSFLITQEKFDLVLLDMNYTVGVTSGKEGLFWLKNIKELAPDTQVIMMTAYGDLKLAVEAMKLGAMDFVIKPWENEKLIATVQNGVRLRQSEQEVQQLKQHQTELHKVLSSDEVILIGDSEAMCRVRDQISKVAETDANILILGENGTGKELIAQAIHQQSLREQQPFIKVDLGALTESLFESELFGHKKGAFTDAKSDRIGRFKLSNNGTLFLDEIGNLSSAMQAKLLSVLQNRKITPVGSNEEEAIDIRLVSATNQPVQEMIASHQFREDLLYRINTIEIYIPPLRSRLSDIELLLIHFLEVYSKKYRKEHLGYNSELILYLKEYPWPGNVREFQHAIERAVIMSTDNELSPEDFILNKSDKVLSEAALNLDVLEKNAIERALSEYSGNMSKAAKELGIGRTTLYRKLEKHHIKL
jgi:DNA-binding NtrC family response regulator